MDFACSHNHWCNHNHNHIVVPFSVSSVCLQCFKCLCGVKTGFLWFLCISYNIIYIYIYITAVYILCIGLIQDLVKVPVYAQYLFQADQAVSDSKGLIVNICIIIATFFNNVYNTYVKL